MYLSLSISIYIHLSISIFTSIHTRVGLYKNIPDPTSYTRIAAHSASATAAAKYRPSTEKDTAVAPRESAGRAIHMCLSMYIYIDLWYICITYRNRRRKSESLRIRPRPRRRPSNARRLRKIPRWQPGSEFTHARIVLIALSIYLSIYIDLYWSIYRSIHISISIYLNIIYMYSIPDPTS